MEEPLADMLLATSNILHWFGRYREANALTLLSRLMRVKKLDTFADLQAYVEREEATLP